MLSLIHVSLNVKFLTIEFLSIVNQNFIVPKNLSNGILNPNFFSKSPGLGLKLSIGRWGDNNQKI